MDQGQCHYILVCGLFSALPTVSAVRQPTWMRAHLLVRHHPLVDSAHAPAPLPETAPFLGAEWDRVALLQQSGVRYLSSGSGTERFFFCGREAKNRSQGGAAALRLQCHLHAIATKKITITSVIRNFFRSSSLNNCTTTTEVAIVWLRHVKVGCATWS